MPSGWLKHLDLAREKHHLRHLGVRLYARTLFHLLINPRGEEYSISKILSTYVKQSVSRKAIRYLQTSHPAFLVKLLDQQSEWAESSLPILAARWRL